MATGQSSDGWVPEGVGCGWVGAGLGDLVGEGACSLPLEWDPERVGDGREVSPDSEREGAAPVRLLRTAAAET